MIQISKRDFELALPVGTSIHDEVYEAIAPTIDITLDNYTNMLLGEAGIMRIADIIEVPTLERYFKTLVAIDAFLSVFRQLDLVLTPTGFGIVSNDTLSPASQQRVDALEHQLRTALCRARAMTVHLLRSADWGTTAAARKFIRYVYSEHYFFFSPLNTGARSFDDWRAMQTAIRDADEQLRLRFGDAQIDDMLDAYRCNDRDRTMSYTEAMQLICDITDQWATKGTDAALSATFRRLATLMDSDADTFALYHKSNAYTAAHMPTFTNKKDSSAFLFNG